MMNSGHSGGEWEPAHWPSSHSDTVFISDDVVVAVAGGFHQNLL